MNMGSSSSHYCYHCYLLVQTSQTRDRTGKQVFALDGSQWEQVPPDGEGTPLSSKAELLKIWGRKIRDMGDKETLLPEMPYHRKNPFTQPEWCYCIVTSQ